MRRFLARSSTAGKLTLVSASKGIELEGHARMSEVLRAEAARVERDVAVAALSGPTFAGELARGVASAAVVAAESKQVASDLCAQLVGGLGFVEAMARDVAGDRIGSQFRLSPYLGLGLTLRRRIAGPIAVGLGFNCSWVPDPTRYVVSGSPAS